ncbi:MAG: hypothetical protein R6X29_11450 [Acidimicrobiia bacterium]
MRIGRVLLGLTLIGVGVLFLMDLTGWVDAWAFIGTWWPVVFIVLGGIQIFGGPRPLLAPSLLIVFGLVMLLFTTGLIDVSPGLVFLPLAAIVAGVMFLFEGQESDSGDARDGITTIGIFSGAEAKSTSLRFRGATMLAAFGAASIDLTEAEIEDRAVIDALVLFGGGDVIVPEHWKVVVSGIPLFGGWSNKARMHDTAPDAPVLRVNVVVASGGFEVKTRQRVPAAV